MHKRMMFMVMILHLPLMITKDLSFSQKEKCLVLSEQSTDKVCYGFVDACTDRSVTVAYKRNTDTRCNKKEKCTRNPLYINGWKICINSTTKGICISAEKAENISLGLSIAVIYNGTLENFTFLSEKQHAVTTDSSFIQETTNASDTSKTELSGEDYKTVLIVVMSIGCPAFTAFIVFLIYLFKYKRRNNIEKKNKNADKQNGTNDQNAVDVEKTSMQQFDNTKDNFGEMSCTPVARERSDLQESKIPSDKQNDTKDSNGENMKKDSDSVHQTIDAKVEGGDRSRGQLFMDERKGLVGRCHSKSVEVSAIVHKENEEQVTSKSHLRLDETEEKEVDKSSLDSVHVENKSVKVYVEPNSRDAGCFTQKGKIITSPVSTNGDRDDQDEAIPRTEDDNDDSNEPSETKPLLERENLNASLYHPLSTIIDTQKNNGTDELVRFGKTVSDSVDLSSCYEGNVEITASEMTCNPYESGNSEARQSEIRSVCAKMKENEENKPNEFNSLHTKTLHKLTNSQVHQEGTVIDQNQLIKTEVSNEKLYQPNPANELVYDDDKKKPGGASVEQSYEKNNDTDTAEPKAVVEEKQRNVEELKLFYQRYIDNMSSKQQKESDITREMKKKEPDKVEASSDFPDSPQAVIHGLI